MTTPYLAGIATIDMTPPVGIPLAGFAGRGYHSSTGVDHPLRAVALSLGDGEHDVVVVTVELVGCYDDFADRIAGGIAERLGLQRDQVLINASHTHCGPVLRDSDVRHHGRIDPQYREELIASLVLLAERAHLHRQPSRLERAVGHCGFAVNRRRPDPDDPTRMARSMQPNPDGPADHEVPVLVVSSIEGTVKAVVFSYACHPTSRGGLRISGDYVGFAMDAVEEAFPNAQPMFLQGCAGDQKPGPDDPTEVSFPVRSVAQVRELGAALGESVAAAVAQRTAVAGPIRTAFTAITISAEEVDVNRVEAALDSEAAYQKRWAEHWHRVIAEGGPRRTDAELELQVIAIGDDLVLIGQGGEMTVEYGLRFKQELGERFGQVVPLGYSNTMVGYVPVARQFDEYGYEVLDANQYRLRSGRWERATEERIHCAVADLVDRLT